MKQNDYNDESIKKEKNSKIFIVIICMLIFIFIVIGTSAAIFTYTKKNNGINTISTGNIYLAYTEDSNGINITDAYPVKDEIGKVLTDQNYFFDFTVNASIVGDVVANYEIFATKESFSTLSDNDVRLYLEKKVNNTYQEVMKPSFFTPLTKSTDLGTMAGAMLLDKGSINETSVIEYRLRMWVSENTVVNELERSFGVRVSVTAKVDLEK